MIAPQEPEQETVAARQEAPAESTLSDPQPAEKSSRRRKRARAKKTADGQSSTAQAREMNDPSLTGTAQVIQRKTVPASTTADPPEASQRKGEKLAAQEAWPARMPDEGGTERRLSFIVRLMIDENGEPRRTEIQDAQTMKRENYFTLDGEQLATFMRACIHTMDTSERNTPEDRKNNLRDLPAVEDPGPHPALSISDVRFFRSGNGETLVPALPPQEAFMIQVHFELQNAQRTPLSDQDQAFKIQIYANPVPGRQSQLLTQYAGTLDWDRHEQRVRLQAPGLSSGVYRLSTQVILDMPERVTGFFKGPALIIH